MTDRDWLLDKVCGCLAGVAIGDALGMPWETMTAQEIAQATDNKGVTRFSVPHQKRLKDTMCLNAGETTDDWQLTKAIADSLIRSNGFDERDIALAHVEAFEASEFGWGGTTTAGVKRIKQALEEGKAIPNALDFWQRGKGTGNGVAMKIAPIAIWHTLKGSLDDDILEEHVFNVGLLTHPDIRASIAAFAVARLIVKALLDNPIHGSARVRAELDELIQVVEKIEHESARLQYHEDTLSKRLKVIWGNLYSINRLQNLFGCSCFCLESVPFAIASFLTHPLDFHTTVLQTVNAGGDTDTTAAIVGALVGANAGLCNIPNEWLRFRAHLQQPITLGHQLVEAFEKQQRT